MCPKILKKLRGVVIGKMGLYKIQERLNRIINRINSKRIYSLKKDEVGINLGCDIETIPSFIGIDGSFLIYLMKNRFLPKYIKKSLYKKTWSSKNYSFGDFMKRVDQIKIIHHNLSYGIPFKDNSIDFIFTSHFLEHLTENQTRKLIKDCFRVLKKNGIIRIIVPELDNELKEIEEKIRQYKKDKDTSRLQRYLTIQEHNSEFGFHKRIYNFKELKKILEENGFKNIVRRKRYLGKLPYLKKLDLRDGLILEAKK